MQLTEKELRQNMLSDEDFDKYEQRIHIDAK